MILVLAEKPSIANTIKNALESEERFADIEVIGIGGHAYIEREEKEILQMDEKDLQTAENITNIVNEGGEDVLLLGKETVLKSITTVKELIKNNPIEEIVNACDPDKSGEYLFQYVYHQLDTDIPVKRMMLLDLSSKTAITDAFQKAEQVPA